MHLKEGTITPYYLSDMYNHEQATFLIFRDKYQYATGQAYFDDEITAEYKTKEDYT